MIVQVRKKSLVSWGMWAGMPIEKAFEFHGDEPVMVETMAEFNYLKGYAVVIGKEFTDLVQMAPIRPQQGIYMSPHGYEIKTWIKVPLHD